jgi:hypothetical protein
MTYFGKICPINKVKLLFGRRGMPGGGKKNLGDLALRELKKKLALVKIMVAIATAG